MGLIDSVCCDIGEVGQVAEAISTALRPFLLSPAQVPPAGPPSPLCLATLQCSAAGLAAVRKFKEEVCVWQGFRGGGGSCLP